MYTLVGVHSDMGLENKDNIQRLKKLNKSLHVLIQISTTCNHAFEPPLSPQTKVSTSNIIICEMMKFY